MIEGHGDDMYRYGGRIKLNFSSNIYYSANLDGLKAYLSDRLDVISAYPEPEPYTLERMLADSIGIPSECVMVTNGATEAIYLIARAYRNMSRYAVRRPTFSEYEDACRMFGYAEADAAFDAPGDILRWICNPNNPTGEVLGVDYMRRICGMGGVTVIDQSYEDYTTGPLLCVPEALRMPGVILLHSMTKTFAIPGLRLGYVTASAGMIGRLRAFRHPWSVNALAIEAGMYLLRDGGSVIPDLSSYLADASVLRSELAAIDGIDVLPTSANFMLCRVSDATAAELKEFLAVEYGMLIRDCSNITGLDGRYFRVAARSREDNASLVEAVRKFVSTHTTPRKRTIHS